jgi:TonB family protein
MKRLLGSLLLLACLSFVGLHAQDQPQDDTVYKVGNGVKPPRARSMPNPEYSEEARQAHIEGIVVLKLVVDTDGKPSNITVVQSLGSGLDEKAIEALQKWRFSPATRDGKPVRVAINVEVSFHLQSGRPPEGDVYVPGNGVTAPRAIFQPDPEYSEEARKARISGTVLLQVVIDKEGNVIDLKVVKSLGSGLDEKAIDTVRRWKFKPASKDGEPVKARVTIEVDFHLR